MDPIRALIRRAPLVLACVVVAAVAAFVLSSIQTTKYEAEASLLFRDPGFDQRLFGGAPSDIRDPDRDAATNIELASLEIIAELTAADVGTDITTDEVVRKVEIDGNAQSNVVTIRATDSDPDLAADLANTFARNYISFRREADREKVREARRLVETEYNRLAPSERRTQEGRTLAREISSLKTLEALQTGNAELVQEATPRDDPASPRRSRNTLLGAALGLLVGIALALLLERFDRRLRDSKELEHAFGLPVLATVPERRNSSDTTSVSPSLGSDSEAFRMLRARLRYFNVGRDIRTVVVTSSGPNDGKTTVAWGLAANAAAAGINTLFLEADFHRPTVAEREGLAPLPGLSEILSNQSDLDNACQTVAVGLTVENSRNLEVVVSGSYPPNPAQLLESEAMANLLLENRARYALVVIDTPPLAMLADAIPLLQMVDGVVVVARLGRTTRDEATELKDQLVKFDAPMLGVVANFAKPKSRYEQYGYYAPVTEHEGPAFRS